jgi:hypothetical protein
MSRSRFLPILFSAGLVLAAACNDAPNAPLTSTPSTPLAPSLLSLSGTVHRSGNKINEFILATDDGQEIPLSGGTASMLARVENDGVEVRGGWNGDGAFEVADFLVETVDGTAVVDGLLVAVYDNVVDTDATGPSGYAILPTRGGPTIALTDPSADLLAHLGSRIWVAGIGDGAPMTFGVISEQ